MFPLYGVAWFAGSLCNGLQTFQNKILIESVDEIQASNLLLKVYRMHVHVQSCPCSTGLNSFQLVETLKVHNRNLLFVEDHY